MAKKSNVKPGCKSCAPFGKQFGTCKIEAMVSIDERGQMVLPKDIRKKMNVQPGDKLSLISWTRDNEVASVSLIKAEKLNELISDFYKNNQEADG